MFIITSPDMPAICSHISNEILGWLDTQSKTHILLLPGTSFPFLQDLLARVRESLEPDIPDSSADFIITFPVKELTLNPGRMQPYSIKIMKVMAQYIHILFSFHQVPITAGCAEAMWDELCTELLYQPWGSNPGPLVPQGSTRVQYLNHYAMHPPIYIF